jgi:hypothetical protein
MTWAAALMLADALNREVAVEPYVCVEVNGSGVTAALDIPEGFE